MLSAAIADSESPGDRCRRLFGVVEVLPVQPGTADGVARLKTRAFPSQVLRVRFTAHQDRQPSANVEGL